MPRKGKRKTITRGVYGDSGGFEIRVVIGGTPYTARMPLHSTIEELKGKRAELENQGRSETPRAERGTLRSDARRYLNLVKHLASWEDREDHLHHWIALYGDTYRHRLTSADVLTARVQWLEDGYAPKTINHFVGTLRCVYRTLDGKKAKSPCDDIAPLDVPKTPIPRVTAELILTVDRNLQAMEARRTGRPMSRKTRARYRVYASTGKRPCEIMRIERRDISWEARVWIPRDAKGGYCPGVYLNDDQLAALRLFDEVDAYGPFSTGAFQRTLISAGWPKDIRPYHLRHNTWIAASELGIDLADISIGAGHKDTRTTRKAYVPVLNSRLQRMSEAMDGRFNGWAVVPDSGTDRK